MKTKLKSFGIKSLAAILSILMVLTGVPLSVFAIDFESDSSSTEISSAEPTHNRISEAFEVEEGKSVVTVEQKIQQLYDAIFVTEYTGNVYHTILGEYEFDDNSKNFVKSVESMLSVYADYNI